MNYLASFTDIGTRQDVTGICNIKTCKGVIGKLSIFSDAVPSLLPDLKLLNEDPIYIGSAAIFEGRIKMESGYNPVAFRSICGK